MCDWPLFSQLYNLTNQVVVADKAGFEVENENMLVFYDFLPHKINNQGKSRYERNKIMGDVF